jgi:hypothetical protein
MILIIIMHHEKIISIYYLENFKLQTVIEIRFYHIHRTEKVTLINDYISLKYLISDDL